MMQCYDEGTLRAYLAVADTLSPMERAAIEEHLAGCDTCQTRLAELRALTGVVEARLAGLAPTSMPQPQVAWQQMRRRLEAERHSESARQTAEPHSDPQMLDPIRPNTVHKDRRTIMQTLTSFRSGQRRAIFSALAAVLVLSLVALPPLRAAADQFLQNFRATSVVFVPVGSNRLAQLQTLDFDPASLFASRPIINGGIRNPHTVGSVREASQAVGFALEQPSALPGKPITQEITVADKSSVSFQVQLNTLRQILSALNITDVTLPDSLGTAPISAEIPPAAMLHYQGSDYDMILVQGRSPTANLPKGVELAQLGKAALEVVGMPPDKADALSKQIDWTSTLVLPFPQDMNNVRQVQIGDAQGLIVDGSAGRANSPILGNRAGVPAGYSVLYWQRGDRFYALAGEGAASQEAAMLAAARSVK